MNSWNENLIFASTDSDEDPMIVINYAKGGFNGDMLYLNDLLEENMQINLLGVKVDEENHYIPELIILTRISFSTSVRWLRASGSTDIIR